MKTQIKKTLISLSEEKHKSFSSSLIPNIPKNSVLGVRVPVLKKLAKDKFQNNILVIANYQTNGRGRLGRTFISDKSSGIYMSLLVNESII